MAGKYTLADLNYSAEINNGKCFAKEYINLNSLVEWRCEKGHRFSLAYVFVQQGAWCPQCQKEEKKQEKLERLVELAKAKGGKLLSKKYTNSRTKYKWQCSVGHKFEMLYGDITHNGYWCKKCNTLKRQKREFERVLIAIKKKGGVCSTNTYVNNTTSLQVKCKNSHVFKTNGFGINSGNWCPTCSGKAKHTMEQLKAFAKTKGGDCLSKRYLNTKTLYNWICKHGHIFKNSASKVLHGQWCPKCRGIELSERYRTDIKEVQKFAKAKGGLSLSKSYKNANIPLLWQCNQGHRWKATYGSVKSGTWCKICNYESKRKLIKMNTRI